MNLLLVFIGSVFIFDTLFIMNRSNMNMGVILPALLGAPAMFYGLFYAELSIWFSAGFGFVVGIFIICCYALFAVLMIVCVILIINAKRKQMTKKADVLIVLGAGVQGIKLSKALKNRLDLAMEYWREHKETILIVSGGQGRQELISEAKAMKDYLLVNGVPEEKIISEDKATSTYENFKFSKEIIKSLFPDECSVLFVTSDFHIFRSGLAAKAVGLKVAGIGCQSPYYIIPNYYMREALAIFRYALVGLR